MLAGIEDLVRFLRHWHRDWLDSPGLAETVLPNDLPDGLRLIYRELGALVELEATRDGRRPPFAAQDSLVPLSRLKRVEGMIEFSWENQGNWSCRCQSGPGDPPVYSNAVRLENPASGFEKVCDSLSHFLTTLCLQEAVMSAPCLEISETALRSSMLPAGFEPLWLRGQYVHEQPSHSFYFHAGADTLLLDFYYFEHWWLAAHDFGALASALPGVDFER